MLKLANALGCRVIRGKDWEWDDEDGGSGYAGTVIGLGRAGHERSCAGTVEVCWDWGLRSNYRVGFQGKYDLRVIDTAQCGIVHVNVNCDSCKTKDIRGFRFKCTLCNNYDLCTRCYHDGDHDLEHPFLRFDQYAGACCGVNQAPRLKEDQIEVRGIFKGATVVKRNWDWLWDFYHEGVVETYHHHVTCDFCKSCPILGARYKCTECHDYDLCTDCYHNGEHHLHHNFTRCKYDQRRFPEPGEELTGRQLEDVHWKWTIEDEETITYCDSCKESSRGLHYLNDNSVGRYIICEECFPQSTTTTTRDLFVIVDNAEAKNSALTVLTQNDWKWTNKYESIGARGFVNDIFDAGKTGRSLAFVKWTDTKRNDYRVGDEGRMELRCVKAATGGIYYENHLPILDLGARGFVNDIFDAGKTCRSLAFVKWTDTKRNDYRVGDEGRMELRCVKAATGGIYYENHLPILDLGQESIADSSISHESNSHDRVRELESKVEALEEQTTCSICLEAPKDVVFHCGHSLCTGCSTKLNKCHICRKDITGRIKLY